MPKLSRRHVLGALPAAAAASAAQNVAPPARPNIILIISDQFRWDCIGVVGLNPMNLTPNLESDGVPRRALPQRVLQPAGMRSGPRQYLHRPVPGKARRMAERDRSCRRGCDISKTP